MVALVAMTRLRSSSLGFSLLHLRRRLLTTAVPTILSRRHFPAPSSPAIWFRAYSPLNSGASSSTSFSDRPSSDMSPLFPGCDYQHWLIVMDKPGGEGATKQQMIDCYVQTLAKVLGSEEEAKKKIYNVSFDKYFGFGCEIDEETSNKMEGLPGVLFALPDSYVDAEHKDYGGELFVNGEIVQRPPERQKRVEPQPQKKQDRPRYNDRTRDVRRRDNTR